MKTAIEAHQEIETVAKANAKPETRDGRGMKIGQGGRQGDIYVYRVPDDWPRGKRTENRQLAIGQSVGSRHIAAGDVEIYEGQKAPEFIRFVNSASGAEIPALIGPLILVKSTEFAGTHPEHAHFLLDPGTYQIVYQMDARSFRRVED